jgi:hypothetical protein
MAGPSKVVNVIAKLGVQGIIVNRFVRIYVSVGTTIRWFLDAVQNRAQSGFKGVDFGS